MSNELDRSLAQQMHAISDGGELVHVLDAKESVSSAWRSLNAPSSSWAGDRSSQGRGRQGQDREEEPQAMAVPDEATEVIAGCMDDMKALWDDPVVQAS